MPPGGMATSLWQPKLIPANAPVARLALKLLSGQIQRAHSGRVECTSGAGNHVNLSQRESSSSGSLQSACAASQQFPSPMKQNEERVTSAFNEGKRHEGLTQAATNFTPTCLYLSWQKGDKAQRQGDIARYPSEVLINLQSFIQPPPLSLSFSGPFILNNASKVFIVCLDAVCIIDLEQKDNGCRLLRCSGVSASWSRRRGGHQRGPFSLYALALVSFVKDDAFQRTSMKTNDLPGSPLPGDADPHLKGKVIFYSYVGGSNADAAEFLRTAAA